LTLSNHVARYNCLKELMVVAIRYDDEDLLAQLGILVSRPWFTRGGMGHLLEIKEHTYRNLILEFLSTLHVEVTRGP